MRIRWSVFAVSCLCGVSVHCSGSDDAAAPGGSNDAGIVADGAQPSDASTPTDSGPIVARVDVAGTLNGRASDGGPLASRDVIVIGADGVVVKTSSDGNGKFLASGVATPYDVGIPYFPTDAAAPAYPVYYAGISRPDPIVYGNDYNGFGNPETQYQATLTWSANVCVGCTMILTSPQDSTQIAGAGPASPFSYALRWFGPTNITEPLHFYIKDATGAYTSYLDIASQALVSNTPVVLGTIGLSSVPSSGTFTLTATTPASYVIGNTTIKVSTSDNSPIDAFSTTTATTVGKFPGLPGVTLYLATNAIGPANEASGASEQILAASASSLTIDIPVATALLTPTDHGTGIPLSQGLTWSPFVSPIVFEGTIAAPSGSYVAFFSTTPSFDFTKLAKAEMALAPATTYTWHVTAGGTASKMDDYVTTQSPPALGVLTYSESSVYQTFTTQ